MKENKKYLLGDVNFAWSGDELQAFIFNDNHSRIKNIRTGEIFNSKNGGPVPIGDEKYDMAIKMAVFFPEIFDGKFHNTIDIDDVFSMIAYQPNFARATLQAIKLGCPFLNWVNDGDSAKSVVVDETYIKRVCEQADIAQSNKMKEYRSRFEKEQQCKESRDF